MWPTDWGPLQSTLVLSLGEAYFVPVRGSSCIGHRTLTGLAKIDCHNSSYLLSSKHIRQIWYVLHAYKPVIFFLGKGRGYIYPVKSTDMLTAPYKSLSYYYYYCYYTDNCIFNLRRSRPIHLFSFYYRVPPKSKPDYYCNNFVYCGTANHL